MARLGRRMASKLLKFGELCAQLAPATTLQPAPAMFPSRPLLCNTFASSSAERHSQPASQLDSTVPRSAKPPADSPREIQQPRSSAVANCGARRKRLASFVLLEAAQRPQLQHLEQTDRPTKARAALAWRPALGSGPPVKAPSLFASIGPTAIVCVCYLYPHTRRQPNHQKLHEGTLAAIKPRPPTPSDQRWPKWRPCHWRCSLEPAPLATPSQC